MLRRTTSAMAGLAVTATLLAGCTGETASDAGSGGKAVKDTLTLGMNADIPGWDPSNQPGYQGWAGEAVWDTLIKCDAYGKAEADIADTWEISADSTSFTAHIREGQKFSDGTAVDSAAVAATFQYSTSHGGAQGDYKGIKIETPDPQNITISWPEPQPMIVSRICPVKITTKALLDSGKVNDTPIGSGPYVLDTAGTTRGSVYAFTKNDNHWNAAGYPYKKLVIKVIESETAAVSALKTKQIDGNLISAQSYNEVTGSGLDVTTMQGVTTRLLLTDHLGKKIPALGDLKVRQAINMVFDRDAMVKSLYQGHGKPSYQIFRPGSDAYLDGLADPYPFDVDKAKALMAEAGFADGFSIELPTMAGQNHETLMPYVTQQLGLLNITVKQVPLSGANAIGDLLSGKYPVVLWQLGNFGQSLQDIDVVVRDTGYWNLSHQPDATVDAAWQKILTGDEAQKKAAQQEINQYVVDQAWFAPMVNPDGFYAHSPDVTIDKVSDIEALTPKLRDFK
ncbi:peptide ABC transporter substrate-binding protein [Actinoplanes sp. OR16]|uniref:ABC transporter substrate-binding protein n=1 Tax=Actinoplanes sp. OR16 TaxID=946334 RepID=UPI000F6E0AFD|nr:ABC transporter substrate-binding protein [Actinoplanes sp. OR16]BBH71881.1 peptide ABC transporter substrate-binding protein [Actinoplanes sp. OR16]